jgi:hypothetical protein
LTRSIHRLHSGLTVIRAEADQQATEILSLQQQVTVLLHNNGKLERAATRLHGKNEKLVLQLLHNKKEKRSLIGHVKDLFAKIRDSEQHQKELQEFNVLYKLQAHEQILLMQQTTNQRGRTDSNFSDADPRERSDSNFSNADALDFNSNTDYDDDCRRRPSRQPGEDDGFSFGYWSCGDQVGDDGKRHGTAIVSSGYAGCVRDSNDSFFPGESGEMWTVILSDPAFSTFLRAQDWVEDSRRSTRRRTQAIGTQGLLNDAITPGKGTRRR